jgi:hypothetical protein
MILLDHDAPVLSGSRRLIALRIELQHSRLNRDTMAYIFSINDNVHHQAQRPQGRADNGERAIYTIVARLPIEADGRIRYRIKGRTENFERVVTEDQISQLN